MPGGEFEPAVKWTGSKRLVAPKITNYIPRDYDTYYEPFLGGGSVLYAKQPHNAVACDRCEPLIELWKLIRDEPDTAAQYYQGAWNRLQETGEQVYYDIRDEFNTDKDPRKLLFLTRTCVNGLIRFNNDGEFNVSLHLSRPGIKPIKLSRILDQWSRRLQGVTFRSGDYIETTKDISSNDFVFLDPPYFNTETMYYGEFDSNRFLNYLQELNNEGVRYALTLDGNAGDHKYSINLPDWAYEEHHPLETGASPHRKVVSGETAQVTQSLFLNYNSTNSQQTLGEFTGG